MSDLVSNLLLGVYTMDENTARLGLHTLLENTFPEADDIYYQPPGNIPLARPCIVYEPKAYEPKYANNTAFITNRRFQVMFMSNLPFGYFNTKLMFGLIDQGLIVSDNRSYVSSDIVHEVFDIYILS